MLERPKWVESRHQRPYRDTHKAKEQVTSMSNQGTRVAGSGSTIGAIIAAMSCTACFPALAILASALGLGFLSQFESISIHYILPLFAIIGLAANVIGGRGRGWVRMVLGIVGPLLVLAAALLMATYGMPTEWLLYPGLVIMIGVAIWDLKTTRT
jgi:mercuric ion transport protein